MRRILTVLAATAFVLAAFALPAFNPVLTAKYHPAKGSDLDKARCGACHVGMTKKLNPFGTDLGKAVGGGKVTPEGLAKVEDMDSDKDGAKNGAELRAGKLPGDPKSKP